MLIFYSHTSNYTKIRKFYSNTAKMKTNKQKKPSNDNQNRASQQQQKKNYRNPPGKINKNYVFTPNLPDGLVKREKTENANFGMRSF